MNDQKTPVSNTPSVINEPDVVVVEGNSKNTSTLLNLARTVMNQIPLVGIENMHPMLKMIDDLPHRRDPKKIQNSTMFGRFARSSPFWKKELTKKELEHKKKNQKSKDAYRAKKKKRKEASKNRRAR